uniref:Uncharacterized protein n=1 Tax=Globodera rostochiensis TaxID=31243 RepID=A0A914I3D5_GLORO
MLFLLVLHLLCIIALSRTTKYVDFDEMYSNLFNLPLNGAINESEKGYKIWEFDQNLKFRLEGALFHSEIDKMFISVKESLLNKQRRQIFEKNQKMFAEFISKDEQQQQQSLVSNCELWKFWRNLGETFDKFNLLDAETQILVQKRDVIDYAKPINCSTIEKAFNQIGEAKKLHKNVKKGWAQIYLDDLKLRHFYAIRLLMTPKINENAEKWKFSNFFNVEMLPNESNFAFQLRLLNYLIIK